MEIVLGNKKSGGKRSNLREERWWPTRKGGSFGRPPQSPGSWHQPVPRWEKTFCTSIGSVPWKKLCETKKLMYMYPTIVEWNDSEGEEAFQNAKARYWAEINRLPCPVPLPDPDMYIDNVDYNAVLDPEMVEDLYKQPPPSQDEGDKGIVWDSFQFTTETVPVTGWGDEEDGEPTIYATESIQIQPSGWGDEEEVAAIYTTDQLLQIQPPGWGDTEEPTNGVTQINRLPCPVPLPDPDMYIDNVDYNAVLDPEMVEDLYKQPPPSQDEGDKGIVWDSFQFTTETVPVTGWGDEEYGEPTICATESIQIQPSGWGDEEEVAAIYTSDQLLQIQPPGWGDTEEPTNEISHKDFEPKDNSGDYQCERDYSWQRQAHRSYEYTRKGHGGSHFGMNDTTGRYRGRKKANSGKEQSVCYKDSMPSCGPVNRGASADSRSSWKWQKSVS